LQIGRLLDNYESFNRVLFIALLVGLGAATASLFVAVWLTPSLFRPLEDIASVAGQITRADDLSRRVPGAERSDEIGDLARSFNQTLERMERLFRSQQRLLADVSHELRTPLTAMRGNVDLMRRMGEVDWTSLDIIHDEIQRMTRLVSDLLLLARADSGGMSLQSQVLELDNLFFEVYRQAQLLPKAVDLVITAVDQVRVYGDPDRLKQLLLNLIDNAIKYTSPGGKVCLALSKSDGWAYVEISDTGVGIPPEDLPHIFDRFYRVDKSRTRQQGGSGLGLSIAKSIAKAHQGDLRVKSEVGVGTVFTVVLPILPETTPVETEESLRKTRPGLRLLGTRQTAEN
jgi:signal transduction histidine kinase